MGDKVSSAYSASAGANDDHPLFFEMGGADGVGRDGGRHWSLPGSIGLYANIGFALIASSQSARARA